MSGHRSLPSTQILGRYEFVRVLHRGVVTELYEGHDRQTGRKLVAKRIRAERRVSRRTWKQIVRETEAYRKVEHPAIVPLLDVAREETKGVWLLFPYVQGESLASWLARFPRGLDIVEVLDIGIQLCDALEYLKQADLIHRDVKPSNIIVDGEGRIRLTDIGVVHVQTIVCEPRDEIRGTIAYMPVEQQMGCLMDWRADLFAFAATLFELASGRRPFEGPDLFDRKNDYPPALSDFRQDAGVLEGIICFCLDSCPEERPESWDVVKTELNNLAQKAKSSDRTRLSLQASSPSEKSAGQTSRRDEIPAYPSAQPSAPAETSELLPEVFQYAFEPADGECDQYGNPVVTRGGKRIDPATGWPYEIWLKTEVPKRLKVFVDCEAREKRGWGPFKREVVVLKERRWERIRPIYLRRMEFVLLPAGQFVMGSPPNEKGRSIDEGPTHVVRLTRPLYVSKYLVTQEAYERVTCEWPSRFKTSRNPVECVSWYDAAAFCERLSEQAQVDVRLLTEAEWEYACRAGAQTAYCFGDDVACLGEYAWYDENSKESTQPVGQKEPNAWGLYDMHGNVREWCLDGKRRYGEEEQADPIGPENTLRALRGGSWSKSATHARCAARFQASAFYQNDDVGFRICLTGEPAKRPDPIEGEWAYAEYKM